MTTLNVNTKPADDLTDEQFLSRDIEIIYDAVTNIYDLSKHDGIHLDSVNTILRMVLEKMANVFNQVETNLSMYRFCDEIRDAKIKQEKTEIMNKYMSASDASPRRVYE